MLALLAPSIACLPANALAAENKPQTITFKSTPPSPALVGEGYTVEAAASSGLAVTLTIDASSSSVCTILGSTVSFTGAGTCKIDANQEGNGEYAPAPPEQQPVTVEKKPQSIKFSSTGPSPGVVGGPTYAVAATGGGSGNPIVFTIDASSSSVCSISGSNVSFNTAGTCTIDANQAGNSEWEAAPEAKQSVAVGKGSQTINFISGPPSNATVGGPPYAVTATASSRLEVSLSSATPSVCTVSGSTMSFIGAGTCTIAANQAGNANYNAAPEAQQSFPVVAAVVPSSPTPTPAPVQVTIGRLPNSSFKVLGATLNLTSYAITFTESVGDPGTFSWVLTFPNGQFGVFAAKHKKCATGSIRLKGRCRPARVLFAKGSQTVLAAGSVTFTVKPTTAGTRALKRAFKQHKALPVTARVTFQSSRGGNPVSHLQSLIVRLRS